MTDHAPSTLTSSQALAQLLTGNQRYTSGNASHPNQTTDHRLALTEGQKPFAAILGCADSRVPPNIIFDQGLGDLFVIRVAGNIIDNTVLGSLEFAVAQLNVPLIVVLGHEGCGAVSATARGSELSGNLHHIAEKIQPAVERAKLQPGNFIDNAIKANVQIVAEQLQNSEPLLARQVALGEVQVIPALYDLHSGKVEVLDNT